MAGQKISEVYVAISGTTVALKRSVMAAKAMLAGVARTIAVPALAGFGGAGFLLARSLSQAVKESSDLGESVSKTRQILGANSAEAEKFAKSMAEAGKNTVNGVLDGLTQTVMALRNQGVGRQMAEGIAKQLEERKIDVASFYNVDPGKIAEDLQSAFAGQTDVLRKYFVYLNADQIKAGGLSAAEAISRAFLTGTAVAKGDFERTKNSIANLQRATMIIGSTAYAKVGESFYGLGQAIEVLKQSIYRFVIGLAESGALSALGQALQESVIAMMAFGKVVMDTVFSAGSFGETLKAIGQAVRDVIIGMIVLVKKPFEVLSLAVVELNLQLINLAQWIASWVGKGDVMQGMENDLLKARQNILGEIGKVVAGIDEKIAAKVAELKKNVESPVNPLGAPAMPKPLGSHGGTASYATALSGAFGRENLQLQEAQKQTKLLEKIAADKPGGQGVAAVVTKPRPNVQLAPGMAGNGA